MPVRVSLTLDDDVAVMLDEAVRQRGSSVRQVLNQALRDGLAQRGAPEAAGAPFRTRTVSVGGWLIGPVTSVSEMLAIAEGEDHS